MEQVTGIEPARPAWEAGVLPLDYTCTCILILTQSAGYVKWFLKVYVASYDRRRLFEFINYPSCYIKWNNTECKRDRKQKLLRRKRRTSEKLTSKIDHKYLYYGDAKHNKSEGAVFADI